jgi:hypothetical protein
MALDARSIVDSQGTDREILEITTQCVSATKAQGRTT